MRIAIYGKQISDKFQPVIYELFEKLNEKNVELFIYEPFFKSILKYADCSKFKCSFFN